MKLQEDAVIIMFPHVLTKGTPPSLKRKIPDLGQNLDRIEATLHCLYGYLGSDEIRGHRR